MLLLQIDVQSCGGLRRYNAPPEGGEGRGGGCKSIAGVVAPPYCGLWSALWTLSGSWAERDSSAVSPSDDVTEDMSVTPGSNSDMLIPAGFGV